MVAPVRPLPQIPEVSSHVDSLFPPQGQSTKTLALPLQPPNLPKSSKVIQLLGVFPPLVRKMSQSSENPINKRLHILDCQHTTLVLGFFFSIFTHHSSIFFSHLGSVPILGPIAPLVSTRLMFVHQRFLVFLSDSSPIKPPPSRCFFFPLDVQRFRHHFAQGFILM